MFCPFAQAGVMGAIDPSTRYPTSPVSGVPSQCIMAALAVVLGAVGVYQVEVGNVAAAPLNPGSVSTSAVTEPNDDCVSGESVESVWPTSVWLEYAMAEAGPTPSS